ncbi:MAG: hypothetical protein LUC33_00050 [Prevotellaceae bacterium]|nr:hypothetical protein [Prevotellaceae bacterium]
MKALRLLGIALVAVALCAGFTACSDDDDDNSGSSSLVGKWTVTVGDDDFVGDCFTFYEDGTFTDTWYYGDETIVDRHKYTYDGTTLKLIFLDEDGDVDLTYTGTFSISGKTLTYYYHYVDEGSYDEEIMVLEKQ